MRIILFWAVILTTGVVYLIMVLWSLPEISRQAGGLPPFDLRAMGYSVEEARAFLAALGEPGREFYRTVQHRLDLVFPGLLALSLVLVYVRLAPRRWALVLSAVVLAAACLDWAENAAVGELLAVPDPGDAGILLASRLTVLKSVAATIGFVALLGLLARAGWIRWARGGASEGG